MSDKLTRSQQLFNRAKDALKAEKVAERNADRDRKILLGAAMIAAMSHQPETRETIGALLDKYTTKPNDRRRVEQWLPKAQA